MDSAVVPLGPFARSLADKYSAFGLFFAREDRLVLQRTIKHRERRKTRFENAVIVLFLVLPFFFRDKTTSDREEKGRELKRGTKNGRNIYTNCWKLSSFFPRKIRLRLELCFARNELWALRWIVQPRQSFQYWQNLFSIICSKRSKRQFHRLQTNLVFLLHLH